MTEHTDQEGHLSSVEALLRRRPEKEYLEEWHAVLGEQKSSGFAQSTTPFMVFRLDNEYLAINSLVIHQVTGLRKSHAIPHMRRKNIQGVVNINGQLKLLFSLHKVLGIEFNEKQFESRKNQIASLIVIQREGMIFSFAVSELYGIYHFDLDSMENIPVNLMKSKSNFLKSVIRWKEQTVGLLDEDLLFFSLLRDLK